jgi:hypothetical protein
MKNTADGCGRRNDFTATNILPAGRARLNAGNADVNHAATDSPFADTHATGRERDIAPLHRGRTLVERKDGAAPGTISGAGKPGGNSGDALGNFSGSGDGSCEGAADLARIPDGVRASVASRPGEYDALRLRSQREIIRDVMISAGDCETWLTLGELRALTRYGEASFSAQLRHLRKMENGGYDVIKRHREGASPERPGTDGRGECVWEYRMTRGMCVGRAGSEARLAGVGA